MKSRIGELILMRSKNRFHVSEKDWLKSGFGRELTQLLSETYEAEVKLNPHTAQPTPPRYEDEYKLNK